MTAGVSASSPAPRLWACWRSGGSSPQLSTLGAQRDDDGISPEIANQFVDTRPAPAHNRGYRCNICSQDIVIGGGL